MAWAVLAILALAGLMILYVALQRQSAGSPFRNDLGSLDAPRAWLAGRSVHAAYGPGREDGYPLPVEFLLAPLVLIPDALRQGLVKVACLAFTACGLWLWSEPEWSRGKVVALLLSLPSLSLLVHDHLPTATGLLAFSLAFWAQRRDRLFLAGVTLALGAIRPANMLPAAAMLLVGAGWNFSRLARLAAGASLVGLPLVALAFWVDPSWVADWRGNLQVYPLAGIAKLIVAGGPLAVGAAQLGVAMAGGFLVFRNRGRPIDLDRASQGLALSVLVAPMDGIYSSLFVLPSLLRASMRLGYSRIPWLTAVGSWLLIFGLSPWLLSSSPAEALDLTTTVVFWLLLNSYPLLRRHGDRTIGHSLPVTSTIISGGGVGGR